MNKILNLFVLLIMMISFSCKKSNHENIEISLDDFSDCPKNFSCTYLYVENAEFGDPLFLNLKKGSQKIFKYSAVMGNGFMAKYVYFKIPMNVTQFNLTNEQVLAGEVKYADPCPSCDKIGVKIIGGHFKGIQVSGASATAKWLVDGQLYLGSIQPSTYRDTVRIKQYFTLDPAGI